MKKHMFAASMATAVLFTSFAAYADEANTTVQFPTTQSSNTTDIGNELSYNTNNENVIKQNVTTHVTKYVTRYVTPSEADFIVSSLINTNVKNLQGENIGQVKDILIRNDRVTGVVMSVGGFLGIGERYVVVDPETINITNHGGRWAIETDASKDSLQNAPEFKYQGHWGR